MSNLGSVSQDSAKLLSEKLALSREVAILKPEIEHLRSQLAHQKDVLAEKLALERQLNALEVELANEKRAAQKVARRQDEESQEEAELRKQVQDLEKQLAKEKKAAQKNLQSRENKDSEIESDLESLRKQLATMEKRVAAENEKRSAVEEELEEARQAVADAEKALATEKRVAQRQAKAQSGANASEAEVAELTEKLSEAERTLEAERKRGLQLRKEQEQLTTEVEDRQQVLDAKVEKLRTKLRETQEELRICRADLERAREQTVTIPRVTTSTVPIKKPAVKVAPKKRPAALLEESILQTPGQDDRSKRPLKKRGFDPSVVEKSTFSITPFLNKTVNLSEETMKLSGDDATRTVSTLQLRAAEETTTTIPMSMDNEPSNTEPMGPPPPKATNALVEKKPRGRPKAKPLADSAPSKKNLTARARKNPLTESSLEKVTEEPDDEPQEQENRSMESTGTTKSLDSHANTSEERTSGALSAGAEAEPKKKKRKLLGASNKPTILEEDEGERVVAKRPPKTVVGRTKVGMGGGAKNAFAGASFSPLKRDRRGVGASFLA